MRSLGRGLVLSVLAVLLVALTPPSGRAAEPIRVGYLGPLSGIFAQVGKDMLDGLKLVQQDKIDVLAGILLVHIGYGLAQPAVSQFWTSKPEEFLKSPAYDRNYPPVKP